ncbi:tetratricopeptide repeat protein [Patescibacteria group bacterium]
MSFELKNNESLVKNKKIIRFLIWFVGVIAFFAIAGLIVWFSTGNIRAKTSKDYQQNAEKFIEKAKYDDAVLALNKAVFFNPSNDLAWYELGEIHRSFHEYTLSGKSFLRSWKAKEDDKYLLAYIESLLKDNEAKKAREFLASIDESDLSNTLLWLVNAKDEKLSKAEKYADKLSDKSQKNYLLSLNYLLKKDYLGFSKSLKNVRIQKSELEKPEFVIWQLFPNSGVLSALKSANNNISNSEITESKRLYSYQAFAELGLGLIAIKPLKDLIADNLNYRDACIVLGEIYYLEEDYTTALEKLKSAEKLDYNYLPTLQLLHKTYLALDQADKVEDYNLRIEKLQFEN